MAERALLRVGSAAAIVAAVLGTVVNVGFPRPPSEKLGDPLALVDGVGPARWELLQLGLTVGLIIALAAFYAVAKSIAGQPAVTWSRLGLGSVVVGTTLGVALSGLQIGLRDGLELVGEAIAGTAFLVVGLFTVWELTYFGLTPVLFGLAFVSSDSYPSWLGWVTIAAGSAGLAAAVLEALSVGADELTTYVLFPVASGLLTLILLYLGVLLARKAREAGV